MLCVCHQQTFVIFWITEPLLKTLLICICPRCSRGHNLIILSDQHSPRTCKDAFSLSLHTEQSSSHKFPSTPSFMFLKTKISYKMIVTYTDILYILFTCYTSCRYLFRSWNVFTFMNNYSMKYIVSFFWNGNVVHISEESESRSSLISWCCFCVFTHSLVQGQLHPPPTTILGNSQFRN